MSAPPYMKLYVGDYLGDTHHLGALEHGAYLLLLMAMWRAGGSLPAIDANLSKMARCTPAEWESIRDGILPFFQRTRGRLTHKRLTAEMAKYENTSGKRSEAGKRGGRQKPSEINVPAKAIAKQTESNCTHNQNQNQNHIKTTDDDSARARFSDIDRATITDLEKRLREAGGIGINTASPMLQVVAPILGLLRPGEGPACDLELDVIPAIMAASTKVRRPVDRWDYFVPMIREARDRRLQGAPAVGEVTQIRSTGPPNSFMDRLEADRAEARRRAING